MDQSGNEPSSTPKKTKRDTTTWKALVQQYQQPSLARAIWQIVDTLVPYAAVWYLMYLSLAWSWWITAALVVLASLLHIRTFIIFHDCCHGSFFKSNTANNIVGFITGVITFTPYHHWRWEHNIHHASSGDLDHRGVGDIWTMTVKEYLQASRWKRFSYRIVRNPVVLFGIAPAYLFIIWQRFSMPKASARERMSVLLNNLALVGMAAALSSVFGLGTYLLLQFAIIVVSGAMGVWMFYVQHQFEDVYWERDADWDYTEAALKGSSYYKLPRILQWFTGNIGFHHIHHLSPRIPNYYLERCHNATPLFQEVKPITLLSSLKLINLRLWDEDNRKLVPWSHLDEIDGAEGC